MRARTLALGGWLFPSVLWCELALLIAVTKPAIRRVAEGVDLAAAAQYQAMIAIRRHCDGSNASQPFDDLRRGLVGRLAVPELARAAVE
eukprot:3455371-Prymnesium_polylepis.1